MIGQTFQLAWEVSLIEWCQANIPAFIIFLFEKVSIIGDTIPLILIIAFTYLCFDKKIGKKLIYNITFSMLFLSGIKNIFVRRRPYFDNPNIECLKVVEKAYDKYDIAGQGFSLPSMHSSNIITIFGTLYKTLKKKYLLYLTIFGALVVGASRFVLGCHYPTDVLIGWVVGILTVCYGLKMQDKYDKNILFIISGLLFLPGVFVCHSKDYFMSYGLFWGLYFSIVLDEKYTNFDSTRNVLRGIIRLAFAGLVFLTVTTIIKLPFDKVYLESDALIPHIICIVRYMCGSFAACGLSPLVYKYNLLKLKEPKKR